jgi:hypothetical protein
MFTILITEMEQGKSSAVGTEKPLRVFFAHKLRKKESSVAWVGDFTPPNNK